MRDHIADAIALAKQRWAAIHSFDLDPETWERLFREHRPGNVLQAIRATRDTRDPEPAKRYARFERCLNSLSDYNNTQQ